MVQRCQGSVYPVLSTVHPCTVNPLVPESKFPPNSLMPKIKLWCPNKNQGWCTLHFVALSYSRNNYSKDFLIYDCDPGGLLVVPVIRHCVNTTQAKMETTHSVDKDVGCKAESKSTAVTL